MAVVTCAQCGVDIQRRPSAIGERNFCSRKCRGYFYRGWFQGSSSPTWKGGRITSTCPICGKSFQVYESQRKDEPRRCCSLACAGMWRSRTTSGEQSWRWNRIPVSCQFCGKVFEVIPSQLARGRGRFCGRACRGMWQSRYIVGFYSPSWRGGHATYYGPNWPTQQRSARKRDGYACQHCGKRQKKHGRSFEVHHIQPFREFGYVCGANDNYLAANELSNLITLCRKCHWDAEFGKIPIQRRFI